MLDDQGIGSVEEFIARIRTDRSGWPYSWFRGEPVVDLPLLPKLYRLGPNNEQHHENKLLQLFRMKAPTFNAGPVPDREATDQWLFLAQHVGLPTRLLDWTESALVALYFALLEEKRPVAVWMLNPIELNKLSITAEQTIADEFPLTWVQPQVTCRVGPQGSVVNLGSINIQGAWQKDGPGVDKPIAILPTNIHPRMSVQRSCFTIHGKCKKSLSSQVSSRIVADYRIDPNARLKMRDDLRLLGISHSTIFPDLDGLAKELSEVY